MGEPAGGSEQGNERPAGHAYDRTVASGAGDQQTELAADGGARRTDDEVTRQLRKLGRRLGRGGRRGTGSTGVDPLGVASATSPTWWPAA